MPQWKKVRFSRLNTDYKIFDYDLYFRDKDRKKLGKTRIIVYYMFKIIYLANEKLRVMPKSLFDVAYEVDTKGLLICLS